MNKLRKWVRPAYRNLLVVITITAVAIAMLMYFLPRESKFGFEFEENRPWRYSQLIAEYDFPIYKSEQEMREERDSLLRNFRPYFQLDTTLSEQKVMELQNDFRKRAFEGVPVFYLPRLVDLLRDVYSHGVISSEQVDQLHGVGLEHILLVRGNVASERNTAKIYTLATAYEHILREESDGFGRELLERCHMRNYLVANVVYDRERTEAERNQLLQVSPTSGMVQKGQLIIDRGQIVTPVHVKVLNSLRKENERRMDPTHGYWWVFAGQLLFTCSLMGLFLYYLKLFRRDYLHSAQTMLLLMTLITIFPVLTYVMMSHHILSVYILPYAIIPIFVRIFFDSRTAFTAVVISALLSSIVLYGPYEFILFQLVVGMTAIYSLRELTERSQVLKTSFAVMVQLQLVCRRYIRSSIGY